MGGLLDLFTILYDPQAVFARVKEKPRCWGPFLGLAVLQVAIAALMMPYTRAVMQTMARAQGSSAAPPSWAPLIGVVGAPIGLAIGLLVAAAILWMLVSVLAGEGSFRHLLAPDATGFVKTLLWTVNRFTLWGLVLTGFGVAGTHHTTKGTAFTVATIAFVINALIGAGFAAIGGGGAG